MSKYPYDTMTSKEKDIHKEGYWMGYEEGKRDMKRGIFAITLLVCILGGIVLCLI